MESQGTNTNTILIVILILIVAGFGFYWYSHRVVDNAPKNDGGLQINIGGGDKGGSQPPAPAPAN